MRHTIPVLALFLALTWSSPVLAQGQARKQMQEVERGFYIQGMVGSMVYLVPPVREGSEKPLIMGGSMGVALGYDVLEILQLEGFVSGAQIRAPTDYTGLGGPSDPRGDFSSLLVGVKGRFSALTLPDNQGVRRFHATVHGGAGLLTTVPQTVIEAGRPMFLAGGGVHYFTRLRHFVIGAEVDVFYGAGANALALYPQARVSYTF